MNCFCEQNKATEKISCVFCKQQTHTECLSCPTSKNYFQECNSFVCPRCRVLANNPHLVTRKTLLSISTSANFEFAKSFSFKFRKRNAEKNSVVVFSISTNSINFRKELEAKFRFAHLEVTINGVRVLLNSEIVEINSQILLTETKNKMVISRKTLASSCKLDGQFDQDFINSYNSQILIELSTAKKLAYTDTLTYALTVHLDNQPLKIPSLNVESSFDFFRKSGIITPVFCKCLSNLQAFCFNAFISSLSDRSKGIFNGKFKCVVCHVRLFMNDFLVDLEIIKNYTQFCLQKGSLPKPVPVIIENICLSLDGEFIFRKKHSVELSPNNVSVNPVSQKVYEVSEPSVIECLCTLDKSKHANSIPKHQKNPHSLATNIPVSNKFQTNQLLGKSGTQPPAQHHSAVILTPKKAHLGNSNQIFDATTPQNMNTPNDRPSFLRNKHLADSIRSNPSGLNQQSHYSNFQHPNQPIYNRLNARITGPSFDRNYPQSQVPKFGRPNSGNNHYPADFQFLSPPNFHRNSYAAEHRLYNPALNDPENITNDPFYANSKSQKLNDCKITKQEILKVNKYSYRQQIGAFNDHFKTFLRTTKFRVEFIANIYTFEFDDFLKNEYKNSLQIEFDNKLLNIFKSAKQNFTYKQTHLCLFGYLAWENSFLNFEDNLHRIVSFLASVISLHLNPRKVGVALFEVFLGMVFKMLEIDIYNLDIWQANIIFCLDRKLVDFLTFVYSKSCSGFRHHIFDGNYNFLDEAIRLTLCYGNVYSIMKFNKITRISTVTNRN